jgi:hypothetical protein
MISAETRRVCREGKPVSTHRVDARGHAFPDHALVLLRHKPKVELGFGCALCSKDIFASDR